MRSILPVRIVDVDLGADVPDTRLDLFLGKKKSKRPCRTNCRSPESRGRPVANSRAAVI